LSIVAIGMGFANMDFFVRECRECVDGDMFIIRFGSCGCLTDLPVGSIVVPRASVAVTRNLDFDFTSSPSSSGVEEAYRISRLVYADDRLHEILVGALNDALPLDLQARVDPESVNASADSFYSSQGRITSFPDHNENLLEILLFRVPGVISLEMETFHLFHLASTYRPASDFASRMNIETGKTTTIPSADLPASNLIVSDHSLSRDQLENGPGRIYACSAQMVFASRLTNAFITPEAVQRTQAWAGRACLEALTVI